MLVVFFFQPGFGKSIRSADNYNPAIVIRNNKGAFKSSSKVRLAN